MSHQWKFFRAGGFNQVKLERGADLANLDQLDQKLWVALACPATGLEFDAKTLQLIDTDNDGRVHASDVIAAAKWATGLLKNPDDLVRGSATLPLSAINDATPEGKQILASAKQTLIHLGKADATAIGLEDTTDTARIFAATNFNGDGLIPVDVGGDDATKAVIADIITTLGAGMDRSGKPGIGQDRVDQFFTEAQAYADWWKQAGSDPQILPLGEATLAAAAAYHAIKPKVDDYFSRCRTAAFDPRALPALNRPETDYVALSAKDLSAGATELAGFPLSQIAAAKPLSLTEGVNPAWTGALATFRNAVVQPLLGDLTVLAETDWAAVAGKFAAFEAWSAAKPATKVEPLGLGRLRAILAGPAREAISALIVRDLALESEATTIAAVEKLVRYYMHLYKLCVNFVSFQSFYSRTQPAIFQAGRLYLDQRSCDLCLTVEDAGRHSLMAGLAGAYLAYCDCLRKATGEKLSIVAVFSQGDDDNLMVGRNGLFYDRKGRDYDATITKIIANPISLRQAFWTPYKRLARFIEEQVAKRAAAADTEVTTTLAATATAPATVAKPGFDPSVVALISVALGSLATAGAMVLTFLGEFPAYEVPLVFAGFLLIVSGPAMVMAYIQLRKRNLGPILDANGWAVNARARINVPFGESLTGIAQLPPGSTVDLATDKFAQRSAAWPKVLVVAFFIWWAWAYVDESGLLWTLSDGRHGEMSKAEKAKADAARTNAVPTVAPMAVTNAPAAK